MAAQRVVNSRSLDRGCFSRVQFYLPYYRPLHLWSGLNSLVRRRIRPLQPDPLGGDAVRDQVRGRGGRRFQCGGVIRVGGDGAALIQREHAVGECGVGRQGRIGEDGNSLEGQWWIEGDAGVKPTQGGFHLVRQDD